MTYLAEAIEHEDNLVGYEDLRDLVYDKTNKILKISECLMTYQSEFIWTEYNKMFAWAWAGKDIVYGAGRLDSTSNIKDLSCRMRISSDNRDSFETLPNGLFPKELSMIKDTEHNRSAIFSLGATKLNLPRFYSAPFTKITQEILTKNGLKDMDIIRGKVENNDVCLALVHQDAKTITVYLTSLAGRAFVDKIVLELVEITMKDLSEFKDNRMYRELSKMIHRASGSAIVDLKIIVAEEQNNLILHRRELHTAEHKEDTTIDKVKELLDKIKQEAVKDPSIKRIEVDSSGKFMAILTGIELKYYLDSDGNSIDFSDYDKETDKIETVKFGDIQFILDNLKIYDKNGHTLNHPHVYREGDGGYLCAGNASSLYSQLMGKLDIVGALRLVISLLSRAVPGDMASEFDTAQEVKEANPPANSRIHNLGNNLIYEKETK